MVHLLVPVHQSAFYVGSLVQNPAAYLDIGQYAVVTVVLEAPAADLQFHGQLLVGIIAFPVQRRFAVVSYFLHSFRKVFQRREKGSHAHVVFRCQQPDVVIVGHKHDVYWLPVSVFNSLPLLAVIRRFIPITGKTAFTSSGL